MTPRKVQDAKDLKTGEKVYLKGHAKVTYMSDGISVEDAITELRQNGGGGEFDMELLEAYMPISRDFNDDFNNDFAR